MALTLPILQASAELAATYAALILADDGIEITVRSLCEALAKIQNINVLFSPTRSLP